MSLPINKKLLQQPHHGIQFPNPQEIKAESSILHMGVGNFHRSHQAFVFQKLRALDPGSYSHWTITGVCFLPSDVQLVTKLRQQDCLYNLKLAAPSGEEEVQLINSIQSVLHVGDEVDYKEIIEKIAARTTSVISFTITEGGYNIDFDKFEFDFSNPNIMADLNNRERPVTVFGILAKGLALRKETNGGPITLLSCDNILQNGNALRFALEAFVDAYDPSLRDWIRSNAVFPNSMVDRITPATSDLDIQAFEEDYGVKDNCLVVAESYFQWVIAADSQSVLYPLAQVGVEFVDDVHPYEEMKLCILNGGHTLTGLLGDALGYTLINKAVKDNTISRVYDRYIYDAVIPVLTPIPNVDFAAYYARVKERFGNELIRDSTGRIISGSSDKIPKFVIPVIEKQLKNSQASIEIPTLVIALWWLYLRKQFEKNRMAEVWDNLKDTLLDIFTDRTNAPIALVQYKPVFGSLAENEQFFDLYRNYLLQLQQADINSVMEQF